MKSSSSISILLTFYLVLCSLQPSYALEAIQLNETVGKYNIVRSVEILEDKTGDLSIHDVSADTYEKIYFSLDEDELSFRSPESTFWVRFKIEFPKNQQLVWLLEVPQPVIDEVTFFRLEGDSIVSQNSTGDTLPFSARELNYGKFVFKLGNGVQDSTYYLRLKSTVISCPLYVWEENSLLDSSNFRTILTGIFFGTLVAISIFAIVLAMMFSEKSFFYYALFIASQICMVLTTEGTGFQYLWRNQPVAGHMIIRSIYFLIGTFGFLFAKEFLHIKKNMPGLRRLYHVFIIGGFLGAIVSYLVPLPVAIFSGLMFGTASMVITYISGIICMKKNLREGKVFILAFSSMLFFVLASLLGSLGLIDSFFFSSFGYQIGLVTTAVLFSIAFVDRIHHEKREKIAAQEEALEFQRLSNESLERRVRERTDELNAKNSLLEDISINLKKYLPKQLVESIVTGEHHVDQATERRRLTVFFSDIKGFTEITDSIEPEELSSVLN